MDPNATLKAIDEALTEITFSLQHDDDEALREAGEDLCELCGHLLQWVRRGGFEPRWSDYPEATQQYVAFARRARV